MTRDKQEALPGILKTTSRFMHADEIDHKDNTVDVEGHIIAEELDQESENNEDK